MKSRLLAAIGVFALLASLVGDVLAQPAPQLGYQSLRDGSVGTTGAGCTATSVSGCGARIGFDKTLTVNQEGRRNTYRATVLGLVPAASATDIAYIIGSATKTVRVTRIWVTGVAGTAVNTPVVIVKRSTANTGGTCTAATNVPVDSANAAATSVVSTCTANPTTGTLVGNIDARYTYLPVATAASQTASQFLTGQEGGQPVTLRGVAQTLAVNLNGVSVSSGVLAVNFEWTEE